LLRERAGIGEQGGGVLVIVLGGNRGNGFSCQADLATTMALPGSKAVAADIRAASGQEVLVKKP
jgi:hypothetical protein